MADAQIRLGERGARFAAPARAPRRRRRIILTENVPHNVPNSCVH